MPNSDKKHWTRRRFFHRYWLGSFGVALLCSLGCFWLVGYVMKPSYSGRVTMLFWRGHDQAPVQSPERAVPGAGGNAFALDIDRDEAFIPTLHSGSLPQTLQNTLLKEFDLLQQKYAECRYKLTVYPVGNARLFEITLSGSDHDKIMSFVNSLTDGVLNKVAGRYGLRCNILNDPGEEVFLNTGHLQQWREAAQGAGLIGGFFIGWFLLYIFIRESSRPRDLQWLENEFKLPVIGIIPFTRQPFAVDKALDSNCDYQRSMHSLHLAVKCFQQTKKRARVCLISSVAAKDGKSTTIAALAAEVAGSGRKVLIIECNWRKPRLNELYKLGKVEGLREVLAGKRTVSEVLCCDVSPGVDLLVSGKKYTPQSMLDNFRKLEEILRGQSENYSLILLDMPDSYDFNDSLIVGQAADCTLLLCDCRKNYIDKLEVILWRMNTAGIFPSGLIVNFYPAHKQKKEFEKYQCCCSICSD